MNINPMRVVSFNQLDLPRALPVLDASLPAEGLVARIELLEPDEMLAAILAAEARKALVDVLFHATVEVIRMTCIKRAMMLIRDNVCGKDWRSHIRFSQPTDGSWLSPG